MVRVQIKREILAGSMENPLYFAIPLRKRLEFLKLLSKYSVPHRIGEYKELRIVGKDGTPALFRYTASKKAGIPKITFEVFCSSSHR